MNKIQKQQSNISGKFIPRAQMSTVVAGVVRCTCVQVRAGQLFSTGTKAYNDRYNEKQP